MAEAVLEGEDFQSEANPEGSWSHEPGVSRWKAVTLGRDMKEEIKRFGDKGWKYSNMTLTTMFLLKLKYFSSLRELRDPSWISSFSKLSLLLPGVLTHSNSYCPNAPVKNEERDWEGKRERKRGKEVGREQGREKIRQAFLRSSRKTNLRWNQCTGILKVAYSFCSVNILIY